VLLIAFVALARLVVRGSSFYRGLNARGAGDRFESLDGLRGFLALGVFFNHALRTRTRLETGEWLSDSRYLSVAATVSVVLFFMITGFLFWSKALAARGRVRLVGHLRGRLLRIGPVYTVSAAAVLLVILATSPWPPRFESQSLLRLLALGGVEWASVNGVKAGDVNAGVIWTLRYEWRFYVLLPVLAFAFAGPRRLACLGAFAAAYRWRGGGGRHVELWLVFLCGMLAAQVHDRLGRSGRPTGPVASALCLLALACIPAFGLSAYHPQVYLPLLLVFVCLTQGNTLFGLLTWPSVKHLGTISFSVYLTHGIVLFVAAWLLRENLGVRAMSDTAFWGFTGVCGAVTVVLSSVTYRFVEHPFIALERRIKSNPGPTRRGLAALARCRSASREVLQDPPGVPVTHG
jgi:peptidoglycan/LPS O-acetylase OafA/YrhL